MIRKFLGNSEITEEIMHLEPFMREDEKVLLAFKFIRDELVLTDDGIYYVDIQGIRGKKKEIQFYPAKSIESVSFETAGTFDLDSDLSIHTRGKEEPIVIKVSSKNQEITQDIIKIMKKYYFN